MKPWPPGSPVSVARGVEAARLVDLGLTDYRAAYELQQRLVERRRNGTVADDLFLIVEHPATFTLGRRGGRQNLMVSEQFLREKNVPLVPIERGGDITFHGPGQLVLYPILHLREAGLTVSEYVYQLEELMIGLAGASGVTAGRDPRNHGVWVGNSKLGSVGIAIRHGVAFHGLALNVSLCLEPFSWVNPCGLAGVRMTTLCRELGRTISLEEVKNNLPGQMERVFSRKFDIIGKDHEDVKLYTAKKDGKTEVAEA